MALDINRLRQLNLFEGYGAMPDFGDQGGRPVQNDFPQRYPQEPQVPEPPAPISTEPPVRSNPLYVQNEIDSVARKMQVPTYGSGGGGDNIQDVFDAINKYYTPSNVDQDRLRGLLDSYPERNDPSWKRKLVASMVSLNDPAKGGGMAGAENTLYAPYLRDLSAWKEKAGPFSQAATAENARNINERQLAGNVVTGITAQNRIDRQAETAADRLRETTRSNEAKEQIARQRDYLRYLAQTETVSNIIKDGPTVVVLFKDGRRLDTGIPSDSVSDLEVEALRQAGSQAAIAAKGAQDRQTNAAPGGSPAPRAADVEAFEQQRRRQAYALNPDLQDHMTTEGGAIELGPMPKVGGGYFGTSWGEVPEAELDKWYQARQLIYPNAPPRPPKVPQAPPPAPTPNVSPSATTGLGPQQVPSPVTSRFGNLGRGTPPPPQGAAPAPPPQAQPQVTPQQIQDEQDLRSGKMMIVINPNDPPGSPGRIVPNTPQTKAWYTERRWMLYNPYGPVK